MSAEWVTAIATLGTFLVIAASATAALIQLRHMRGSNQIAALTEFRETMESDKFQAAQAFVSFELPKRLKDPVERVNATQLPPMGEYTAITTVANMFEALGGLVKSGVIDREVACDVVALIVVRNWDAMLPLTTYVRRKLQAPALWENFEYLRCSQNASSRRIQRVRIRAASLDCRKTIRSSARWRETPKRS
jgi:hypothetical protein